MVTMMSAEHERVLTALAKMPDGASHAQMLLITYGDVQVIEDLLRWANLNPPAPSGIGKWRLSSQGQWHANNRDEQAQR